MKDFNLFRFLTGRTKPPTTTTFIPAPKPKPPEFPNAAQYINNICLFDADHAVAIQAAVTVLGTRQMVTVRHKLPGHLHAQLTEWAREIVSQSDE